MAISFRAQPGEPAEPALTPWRKRLHDVIFEADTPAGKRFDVALLICIVLSVVAVMLDSIEDHSASWEKPLLIVEWVFTILFTIEYVLRLICVRRPLRYAISFFGLVDLLAIIPTYLGVFLPGEFKSLLAIRVLRLLRVFRIFKMVRLLHEGRLIVAALKASSRKISVFVGAVLTVVIVVGSIMYVIERGHPDTAFTSIPRGMYWAIVTMTTVGYGDVVPHTPLGQALASFLMILGYGIIAVPTGIVTVEMSKVEREISTKSCLSCSAEGHTHDAVYCKYCGAKL